MAEKRNKPRADCIKQQKNKKKAEETEAEVAVAVEAGIIVKNNTKKQQRNRQSASQPVNHLKRKEKYKHFIRQLFESLKKKKIKTTEDKYRRSPTV